ncbi:hypothetical protein ASG07_03785 [Sphingomonas sp. Leaf343]|nr:hypothetical protein ASG07_03785 [Sphingomonas sp. Leaf343]
MSRFRTPVPLLAALCVAVPLPLSAAPQSVAAAPDAGPPQSGPGYADLADLVLAAPVIVDATIRSTTRIKGAESAGVASGLTRYYVEADVGALVRGAAGVPARIGYLLDVAPDARGRQPRLKKARVLLFARPVAAAGDQLQLVAPDAQLAWTPAMDATVRTVAKAVVAADAPPSITSVGNAFHVPGALPGESETQVFLKTADARPVSLSILRRPGEQPRWSVALGEIVDDAAGPPARDTLLWYRLACALPPTLPDTSVGELDQAGAVAAREDYAFVIAALGPCGRTRGEASGGASGGAAPA